MSDEIKIHAPFFRNFSGYTLRPRLSKGFSYFRGATRKTEARRTALHPRGDFKFKISDFKWQSEASLSALSSVEVPSRPSAAGIDPPASAVRAGRNPLRHES
jgi:hypothetical protein